jgi:rSAM/selenodomain-associated transferase 1
MPSCFELSTFRPKVALTPSIAVYNFGMRPVVVLFAKAPLPGRVKTRLAAHIGALAAAQGHRVFVRDLLERLQLLGDSADLELHTDIPTDAWDDAMVARRLQRDAENLGERLWFAGAHGLSAGRPQVVIVGSDAPDLPLEHIRALLASAADVALGPAEDGGFYAIAMRRADARMFHGVRWSGPETLAQTMRAVERCGFRVELGPRWYDVDTPQDLARLAASPQLPPRTARWLRELPEGFRMRPTMEV